VRRASIAASSASGVCYGETASVLTTGGVQVRGAPPRPAKLIAIVAAAVLALGGVGYFIFGRAEPRTPDGKTPDVTPVVPDAREAERTPSSPPEKTPSSPPEKSPEKTPEVKPPVPRKIFSKKRIKKFWVWVQDAIKKGKFTEPAEDNVAHIVERVFRECSSDEVADEFYRDVAKKLQKMEVAARKTDREKSISIQRALATMAQAGAERHPGDKEWTALFNREAARAEQLAAPPPKSKGKGKGKRGKKGADKAAEAAEKADKKRRGWDFPDDGKKGRKK
jgi:hypothetical protein